MFTFNARIQSDNIIRGGGSMIIAREPTGSQENPSTFELKMTFATKTKRTAISKLTVAFCYYIDIVPLIATFCKRTHPARPPGENATYAREPNAF